MLSRDEVQSRCLNVEVKGKSLVLRTACSPWLVEQLETDRGLRVFSRQPSREHQRLLDITRRPENVLSALLYPRRRDRWTSHARSASRVGKQSPQCLRDRRRSPFGVSQASNRASSVDPRAGDRRNRRPDSGGLWSLLALGHRWSGTDTRQLPQHVDHLSRLLWLCRLSNDRRKSVSGPFQCPVRYELFVSTLPSPAFTASDVLDLYLHRGSFETVLADEDDEQNADRWYSHTACGQEFSQILAQWVWNIRLELGQQLSGAQRCITEFAPALSDVPRLFVTLHGLPASFASAFGFDLLATA